MLLFGCIFRRIAIRSAYSTAIFSYDDSCAAAFCVYASQFLFFSSFFRLALQN